MTKQDILNLVTAENDRMKQQTRGVCVEAKYRIGKINGMLLAFERLGELTHEEACEIYEDVWEG